MIELLEVEPLETELLEQERIENHMSVTTEEETILVGEEKGP